MWVFVMECPDMSLCLYKIFENGLTSGVWCLWHCFNVCASVLDGGARFSKVIA